MSSDRIVWMDLEMTGLDPKKDRIIEIAALVTNGELEIIAEGPNVVIHQSDELLATMDEWNTSHHGASGLTDRVRTSTVSEDDAEQALLAFLQEHVKKRKAPLAGNSIHQDRRFIARYLPLIDAYLHYRLIDVSSIKELAARWYPTEYAARPGKHGSHRALDDIRESISELRYYRSAVFAPREKPQP